MIISSIQLFQLLKGKLAEEAFKKLLEYVERTSKNKIEQSKDVFSTKQETAVIMDELRADISELKLDLKIISTSMEFRFAEQIKWMLKIAAGVIIIQSSIIFILIKLYFDK